MTTYLKLVKRNKDLKFNSVIKTQFEIGSPMFVNKNGRCGYLLFLWFCLLFLLYPATYGLSQQTITLEAAVSLAQKQSPYYHKARNVYEKGYWRFDNFKAGFKPQVRFNATIPTFYRAINPITQPDGTIRFVRVSQANNSAGFNIRQNIGFTGGILSAGTSLQRTDNFSGDKSSYLLSTPIQLSYQQGSLLYNNFTWLKKLEPLLFETAKRGYSEDLEIAALEATKLFFEVLTAQVAVEMAITNLASTDTLFKLTQERFALGTVGQTDLLQLELNMLKARNQLGQDSLVLEESGRNLKRILNLDANSPLLIASPPMGNLAKVDFETALVEARANRPAVLAFRSNRIQADQEIAKAKGENSLEVSLFANLGTQQTAPTLSGAYQNLQNQQYIGLTVDVPILDWGYRKSQIRLAKANRELIEVTMGQEELNFEQEIYMQVLRFNMQKGQVLIAQKADTIAQQRNRITQHRYLLGKQSVTDLNLAIQERISARQNYIQALKNYWTAYYTLRRLTLFDFVKQETLYYKFD